MHPQLGNNPQTNPSDPKLHAEICSVLELYVAYSHKIYFSGPLVRKYESNPYGQGVAERWVEVWAQLGGNCLSVWVKRDMEAASKEGREVPPSYTNVTDSFTQIIGSMTTPENSVSPQIRYSNVLTLNTAGTNLYLFSCPDTPSLVSWTAAIHLAAWERSRLEELYTASLLRTTLPSADIPTTLVNGKLEGWARVRISGETEWRKVWLVVQAGVADYDPDEEWPPAPGAAPANPTGPVADPISTKKKRMSNLFSFQANAPPPLPRRLVSIYNSPRHKKKPSPFTMYIVRQAYAVYPDRPELIKASSLIKVVGVKGDQWRGNGFMLILPDGGPAEMLKWIVALHDAFELYGRPREWNWDHRDPVSLLFGYPAGPQKAELFLDRATSESMDPRENRVTKHHATFKKLLKQHKFPSQ